MQFFLPSLWKIDRNYLKIHDPTFKKKFDLHKDAMAVLRVSTRASAIVTQVLDVMLS